ncbi:MAG: hypothetical protein RBQ86_05685 [Candidatus Izemoplasmatales bacterium]|jgi:hypothetical protein|nr:hypothetical protein [Candidatus Izemoplasmatales bacterium]
MSGYWTLATIKMKVRALTGRPSTSQLTETELLNFINNYYQLVFPKEAKPQELSDWFTVNTIANIETVAVDQEYLALFKPFMVAGEPHGITVYTDINSFYRKWPLSQTFTYEQPRDILLTIPTLVLRPIPDAVYEIRSWSVKRPDALVNSSDEPLNQEWGQLIAYGTAIDIKQDNGEDISGLVDMYNYLLLKVQEKKLIQMTQQRSKPRF